MSRCGSEQLWQADEIVSGHGKGELPIDLGQPTVPRLALWADGPARRTIARAGRRRPAPDETGTPSSRRGSRHRGQTRRTGGTTADRRAPPPAPHPTANTSVAATALSIKSGGYDGRPQAPDRTGLTNRSSGAHPIDPRKPPVRTHLRPQERRRSSPDPSSCAPSAPPQQPRVGASPVRRAALPPTPHPSLLSATEAPRSPMGLSGPTVEVLVGLALEFGVKFGADADRVGRDVEPHEEDDDGAERAERLVVAAEVLDVERESDRCQEPEQRRDDGARAHPLHPWGRPARREAVEHAERQDHQHGHDHPAQDQKHRLHEPALASRKWRAPPEPRRPPSAPRS